MLDAILQWAAGGSPLISQYSVTWSYNGAPLPAQIVPATQAGDASGYSLDFANANPSVTVKAGDIIGASIMSMDVTDGLQSIPVAASPVTEPTPPPPPVIPAPQNVTLTLS